MTANGNSNGHNGYNADMSPLKVIIVGAGLSGLGAAIQSSMSGHSILVLESAKELGEVRTH
jgi:salicylate hydroxylase